jgi:hypothetical protein
MMVAMPRLLAVFTGIDFVSYQSSVNLNSTRQRTSVSSLELVRYTLDLVLLKKESF